MDVDFLRTNWLGPLPFLSFPPSSLLPSLALISAFRFPSPLPTFTPILHPQIQLKVWGSSPGGECQHICMYFRLGKLLLVVTTFRSGDVVYAYVKQDIHVQYAGVFIRQLHSRIWASPAPLVGSTNGMDPIGFKTGRVLAQDPGRNRHL